MDDYKEAARHIANQLYDRGTAPNAWRAAEEGALLAFEEADDNRAWKWLQYPCYLLIGVIVVFTVHHLVAAVTELLS